MDRTIVAGLYGRVSSDRQELEDTIQSQIAELRSRLAGDGIVAYEEFVDEAYSRDNLVRPGLDRLRDLAAQKRLDCVYIQSPDRLASGAKLVVVVEELQDHGVEVVFLKGGVDQTPEGKLLLHFQGAMAEYERTKITERTRRGKLRSRGRRSRALRVHLRASDRYAAGEARSGGLRSDSSSRNVPLACRRGYEPTRNREEAQ